MAKPVLQWVRSSHCADHTCVEVADAGDAILVRDGKNADSHILSFDRRDWHAFLDAVATGDLRP